MEYKYKHNKKCLPVKYSTHEYLLFSYHYTLKVSSLKGFDYMTATRRNVCITNAELDKYLDTCPNVSQFLQEAALFYLQEKDNVYAKDRELKALERKVDTLKEALNKIVEAIMAGGNHDEV